MENVTLMHWSPAPRVPFPFGTFAVKPVTLTVSPLLAFMTCPFGTVVTPPPPPPADDAEEPPASLLLPLGVVAPQAARTAVPMHIIVVADALSRLRGHFPAAALRMNGDCPVPDHCLDDVTPTWKRMGGARVVSADPEIRSQGHPR